MTDRLGTAARDPGCVLRPEAVVRQASAGANALYQMGLGLGLMPLLGSAMAGGLLAATGGAAALGYMGALMRMGLPPSRNDRREKEVFTEQQTVGVPVMREGVVIERRPVAGQQGEASNIRAGEAVRILVREEPLQVEKQTVVKEEIWVGKHQVADTEKVCGEVRQEKVHVERRGNVNLHRMRTPDGPAAVSEEEIRRRAYAKWEAADRPAGDGRDHWLEAKRELEGR